MTAPPAARDKRKGSEMSYTFDPKNLPENLTGEDAQTAFKQAVQQKLVESGIAPTDDDALVAAIIGMMVLDGNTDPSLPSFHDGFWNIRRETSINPKQSDGTDVPYSDACSTIATTIASGRSGSSDGVYYQELAFVARHVLEGSDQAPVDSGTFFGQIRVVDDQYVSQGPVADTLDIPSLAGADGGTAPDDVRPDNIRAVAVIYAAWQLEQVRVFEVVDRITETWWNGQLPNSVGDTGSRLLDQYYWSSEFRLSDAARHMQYGRVLGAPGGEVSTEVQPNTQFNDLLMRFVSSLAEYDRQQRVGDIVSGQKTGTLTLTGEQVRQSGRNLAANASLYGFGGTQFAARRLADHAQQAFAILNAPDIQSAYGVDGPWKVIERVTTTEFGASPNIVKFRTMADSGKRLLDLIAKYSTKWSSSTGTPLFADRPSVTTDALTTIASAFTELPDVLRRIAASRTEAAATDGGGGGDTTTPASDPGTTSTTAAADIPQPDQDEFMRQAGNWLAVNGIKDDQVEQYSQPAETQYAPSIPTLGPSPAATSNGGQNLDQLRQMVSQGQVPSLDQLKSLVMPGTN